MVLEKGELLPAIQASMAVPGVFGSVSIGNKVLVDGGVVNLVPYDHRLTNAMCRSSLTSLRPNSRKTRTTNSFGVNSRNFRDNANGRPCREDETSGAGTVYVRPEINDVRMFDFNKIEDVFLQAQPAIRELRILIRNKILENE